MLWGLILGSAQDIKQSNEDVDPIEVQLHREGDGIADFLGPPAVCGCMAPQEEQDVIWRNKAGAGFCQEQNALSKVLLRRCDGFNLCSL